MVKYVYPEFSSIVGVLRSRACRIYAAFRKLDFSPDHLMNVLGNMIHLLDDPDFSVCISAALSLQSFFTKDSAGLEYIGQNLQHIVERYIFILQKVAVEEVMQSFDVLINMFEDRLLPMSAEILNILLSAFKDYKKDEDNDNAVFTAMSTIDCISSIVINGCENPQYYDTVVTAVLPTIVEIFSQNECDFYDASLMIVRSFANFYSNAQTTQNMIWELFPRLLSIIQTQAIDYISGFFSVVDCYMSIPGSGMLDHQFNGKSYLELVYDFVSSVVFDPEISDMEQCYAMGILMIIIQYYMSWAD